MTTLTQASKQHMSRPADERYTSLYELAAAGSYRKENSRRRDMANKQLRVLPSTTDQMDVAVEFTSSKGSGIGKMTHWSFGQMCALGGVPSEFLRSEKMPGALAADTINWGLHVNRGVEDVNVNLFFPRDSENKLQIEMRSVNGPNYGAIWDADIDDILCKEFGDGRTGSFRIPGHFNGQYDGTKENTTLYAGDRDSFRFLADEEHRVTVPNRRDGKSGTLARGFMMRNSEVGASRFVLTAFLFDYMCCNHMIWNVGQFHEIAIRHTSGAPFRWNDEIKPFLRELAQAPLADIDTAVRNAQQAKIKGDVEEFLATRFGTKTIVPLIQNAHFLEEGRPIETVWDAVTGATAYARELAHIDTRVKIERDAGKLLAMAL